jgi:predicted metal-dependent peptidase
MAKKEHTNTATEKKSSTVTDPAIDRAAMDKLVVSRISLLMHHPFFGNIATRFILKNADDWLPTAAMDGRHLYYNSEFVNKLRDKEVIFLVGHEMLHAIYDHVGTSGRCNGRDPRLFNIAADYAINRDLIDYKIGERITTVPTLYDKRFDGLAAEEIYDILYDEADKIDIEQLAAMVLDEHMDGDDDEDGEGDGEGKEGSGRPKLSPEERQAIADEIKEAMLSAAQAVGIGQVPAGMKRYIDGLTEPKMNWKEILQQTIESQVKNDFTFMKPSRRGWSCDAILPSMKKEPTIEVTIALDLSGSIGQAEMKDFISEIAGMCEQYADYKITICTWDCSCYFTGSFTGDDGIEAIMQADFKGGGGTSPGCIWKWCEDNDHEPKQLLIFSDMFIDNSADSYADVYPTIWLSYKNPTAVAPHGELLHFD